MRVSGWIGLLLVAAPIMAGDWDPGLAANYLDARQKAWFEWPRAKATGGPCISCHTNAPYLLARPVLRRVLGESQPTAYETGLLNALRARVESTDAKDMFPSAAKEPAASQGRGVEGVLAALFLSLADDGSKPDSDAQKAFDRLWSLQLKEGPSKGAWPWFSRGLDPYEMPHSAFCGAALAAVAVAQTSADYRNRSDVRAHLDDLKAYLLRERESQPLHNQLFLVWASARLPDLLPPAARQKTINEVLSRQNTDGGWTIQSLGPWQEHAGAPPSAQSNSYATALVSYTLAVGGVPRSSAGLAKAIQWLESHQDRQTGYWAADSMNKRYPSGSMEEGFMRDTATAFASMALADATSQGKLK
ncbi:MAG TPA: prenyltransferase/squalene oxidase repeat-containing protein [Bryobacteraceae bacterium]|nr:prenyltransferase/squalene oxidase repeat-containing protein [Bryobacteraceae bacterium]